MARTDRGRGGRGGGAAGAARGRMAGRGNDLYLAALEGRVLLSAAFDVTGITGLRADSNYFVGNGPTADGGRGSTVAVLDTGGYAQNPDLVKNFLGFYDAVAQPET